MTSEPVTASLPPVERSVEGTSVSIGRQDREPLDHDSFCRMLIGELAQTLQDVVGIEESAGFVAVVGQMMGGQLSAAYRAALDTDQLDRHQLADILVDLKRRIGGGFSIESVDRDRIVLVNTRCPFGERVIGRPSLCMMTSNVFGAIAADSLGYAKVRIDEAIARGDAGCRVVVWIRPVDEARRDMGREYFSSPDGVGTAGAT